MMMMVGCGFIIFGDGEGPFGADVFEAQVEELEKRVDGGEKIPVAADLAKRAVERLDGIGGVDDFADLRGEVEEGGELVPVGLPAAADGGVFGIVGGAEGFQRASGGLLGGGAVDGLEVGGDLLALLPVDEFEAVAQLVDDAAQLVDDAALDPALGKDRFEGLGKAAEAVDAADEDVLKSAVFELGGDGEPEARAFVFR
jgi:hypothetical protein